MKIVRFDILGDYRLRVCFDDGVEKVADMKSFLLTSGNPLIRKFLDKSLFDSVQLDDFGVLVWGDDDMDINPQAIYNGQFSMSHNQTT